MPLYVILRTAREDTPSQAPDAPLQVAIKFFPIRGKDKEPITLAADSPEEAHALARMAFPYLALHLAVQPLKVYRHDLAKFAALPAREYPRGETRRAVRPAQAPGA